MNYEQLHKLHVEAVRAVDMSSMEERRPTVQIKSDLLAYLTDKALEDLAIGVTLHRGFNA